MRRREVLALAAAFLASGAVLPASAQTAVTTRRIGVLLQVPPTAQAVKPLWAALIEGLREHGWEEGKNLVIEGRFAGQDGPGSVDVLRRTCSCRADMPIAVLAAAYVLTTRP